METSSTLIPAGAALVEIQAVLDRIDPDRSMLDAASRLGWVRTARRVRGRIDALTLMLTAEADQARAAETATGTSLVSWLGIGETLSRREAAGAVTQARRLGQHRLVGDAAVTGRVVPVRPKPSPVCWTASPRSWMSISKPGLSRC